jgi:uncharacterized glyoxalase superfamily protein PhnB
MSDDQAPAITPVLRYRDALAAIEFLERAFGFKATAVYENGDRVEHAQLVFGDGMVMLSTDSEQPWGSHAGQGWTYVVVDDTDAHHERARAAGADVIREPEDQEYGSRDYTARDPEGNLWSFGTYRASMTGE